MYIRKNTLITLVLVITILLQSCAISYQETYSPKVDKFTRISLDLYEEISHNDWKVAQYHDKFGEPINKYFIRPTVLIDGSFSNSATTNSKLYGSLYIDRSGISIALVEYGSNLVKASISEIAYKISIRLKDGTVKNIGRYSNNSDRITIPQEEATDIFKAIASGYEFKIFLEENNYGDFAFNDSSYLLNIPASKGLAALYLKTFESHNKEYILKSESQEASLNKGSGNFLEGNESESNTQKNAGEYQKQNIFIGAEPPRILDPEAKLGTRKNPVPIGEPFEISAIENGKIVSKLIISIVGVTRGEDALKMIKKLNQFNPSPNPGMEYVLPLIYVENKEDLSGQDYAYHIDQFDFEVADAGYSNKKQFNIVAIGEPFILDAKLHSGSYTLGIIPIELPVNNQGYLVFDGVWFWLGTKSFMVNT